MPAAQPATQSVPVDVDAAQVVGAPAEEAAPVVSSLKKQLLEDCASSAFGEQDASWATEIHNALVKYVSCTCSAACAWCMFDVCRCGFKNMSNIRGTWEMVQPGLVKAGLNGCQMCWTEDFWKARAVGAPGRSQVSIWSCLHAHVFWFVCEAAASKGGGAPLQISAGAQNAFSGILENLLGSKQAKLEKVCLFAFGRLAWHVLFMHCRLIWCRK